MVMHLKRNGHGLSDQGAHGFFDRRQDILDRRNRLGVRAAGEQYGAFADSGRALDFHGELPGRLPARARDAAAVRIERLVARRVDVQRAFRLVYAIRIALFVETVGGHRHRRRMTNRVHAVDDEAFAVERAEQRVAPARCGAERGAFDDLGQVHRRPQRIAQRCRDRRVHRSIAGTAGNHHLGPRIERALEGFDTHLADDVRSVIDITLGKRRYRAEGAYFLVANRALDQIARHVGGDRSETEMQACGTGDVAHHLQSLVEMRRRARGTGGSKEQRDAEVPRAAQYAGEVVARHGVAGGEIAAAEIVGPRIDRAHVSADEMRLAFQSLGEGRFGNAVAQLAGGGEHPQRPQPGAGGDCFTQPSDRGHISTSSKGPCCCAP